MPDGLSAPTDRLDRHRYHPRTVGRYRSDRPRPTHRARFSHALRNLNRFPTQTATAPLPPEDVSRLCLGEGVLMQRDNQITFYVSDETKAELERGADDEDMTLSPYIDTIIRRYFIMEAEDQIATEVRAEERLEELIALGKDELRDVAREIADMNAKMGVYAAANFELMKTDHPDAMRRDALSTGSRRIRQDVDLVHDDHDDAAGTTDTPQAQTDPQQQREPGHTTDAPETHENDNQNQNQNRRQGPLERIRDADASESPSPSAAPDDGDDDDSGHKGPLERIQEGKEG